MTGPLLWSLLGFAGVVTAVFIVYLYYRQLVMRRRKDQQAKESMQRRIRQVIQEQ